MTFAVKDWRNKLGGGTPLNAAGLEDMEHRLSDYTDVVVAAEAVARDAAISAEASARATAITSVTGSVTTEASARAAADSAISAALASETAARSLAGGYVGQKLLAIMQQDRQDVAIAAYTDSVGAESVSPYNLEWVYRLAQRFAAAYPAYTVLFYPWDQAVYTGSSLDTGVAGHNVYRTPLTVQTGTGTHTLRVYSAGLGGNYVNEGQKYLDTILTAPLRTTRTSADGVTTSGSTTLTSASLAFSSSDVGTRIIGSGIPDGTTIASVTNSTTVVLSAPATATASSVALIMTDRGAAPDVILTATGHNFSQGSLTDKHATMAVLTAAITRAVPDAELVLVAQNPEWNDTPRIVINATGGTFKVAINGVQTGNLAWNISAASMQTALAALSGVGAGNVQVFNGKASTDYVIVLSGPAKGKTVTTDASLLTGGTHTATASNYPNGMYDWPVVLRALAQMRGYGFIDVYRAYQAYEAGSYPGSATHTPGVSLSTFSPDGTHPDDGGYTVYADTVYGRFVYDPNMTPRSQQPSSLLPPHATNLLKNGDQVPWTSTLCPDDWTPVSSDPAVMTVTKDFVNYESDKGYSTKITSTGVGSCYIYQTITGKTLERLLGKWVCLAVRMRNNTVPGGASNGTDIQAGVCQILDGVQTAANTGTSDEGIAAWRWVSAIMKVDPNATSLTVRLYGDFGGDGTGTSVSIERAILSTGVLPRDMAATPRDPLAAAVVYAPAESVAAVADGTAISAMVDATGRGNHPAQSVTANKPKYRTAAATGEATAAIDFDGAASPNGDFLNVDFTIPYGRPYTLLVMGKFLGAYNSSQYLVASGGTSNLAGALRRSSSTGMKLSSTSLGSELTTTPESIHCYVGQFDSPGGRLSVDGGDPVVDVNIGGTLATGLTLGANTNGANGANFRLFAVAVIPGVLSAAEKAKIIADWTARYNPTLATRTYADTVAAAAQAAAVSLAMLRANNGSDVADAAAFRANLSLRPYGRTTFSNADATLGATTVYAAQIGTMSAPRTVTLPAASAVPAGWEIIVGDASGSVTSTNTITVQRAGADTVNGATSTVIAAAYGWRRLISNGVDSWTFDGGVLRSSQNLSELQSAATARTNLGLGAVAVYSTADLATAVQAYRLDQFAAPNNNIPLNSKRLTGAADPVGAQDVDTKAARDAAIAAAVTGGTVSVGGDLIGTLPNPTINEVRKRMTMVPTGAIWSPDAIEGIATTTLTGLTSGTLMLLPIWLPNGLSITKLGMVTGTTGITSPTHQRFGLYSTARAQLATTNDDTTTAWAASTHKELTITGGPYVVPANGIYLFACLLVHSGTCTFTGTNTPAAAPLMAGMSLCNTADTGVTSGTLPANAAAMTGRAGRPYVYMV